MLPDQIDRLAQDGQVGEAQEVELEQPQRLDAVHLVLGHDPVRVRGPLQRHEVGERLARDHDSGRMRRSVPRDALQVLRELDDAMDRRLVFVHLLERRACLDRLFELDAELVRDGFGHAVAFAVGHAHDPSHVSDRRPGQHRAEGDDLGDVVGAVLAADVVDDLLTPAVFEVDVDIRHGHAIRVEEPLEGQLVVDRVDGRDAEGVGHDAARRRTADRDGDALLAGECGEIGHDQEVARVAHAADDVQLVVEAGLKLRRDGAVAARQAGLAFLSQP